METNCGKWVVNCSVACRSLLTPISGKVEVNYPVVQFRRFHAMMIENHFSHRRTHFLALCLIALVSSSGNAWSQSILPSRPGSRLAARQRLPNPVRTAGFAGSVPELSWESGHEFVESELPLNALRQPTHSHHILRSPEKTLPQKNASGKHATTEHHFSKRLVHPPYSPYRRRMQPDPPTLPGGNQRETWKTPYSYGYFGASGTRHWSLHHGYRDRYTEWRLK